MILAKPLAWNPSIVLISSGNTSAVICIFVSIEKSLVIANTICDDVLIASLAFSPILNDSI